MKTTLTLKSFNQFNYSIMALKIDYAEKTAYKYYGGACPINYDKKVSTKAIKERIEELQSFGFKIVEK